ncbi:DNA-binding response regulator [Flavonifractor sp. An135]|nr:DNA-binding response regulator [Flavonifractor sp. An135]
MALTGTDTSVTCRSTLTLARETLAEERFDLLILDINLPDGSGLDLLRQVRMNGDSTPVILLTANDLELDEVTGLEAGADDYITKPFSLAVLRARVNAQLRRGSPTLSQTMSIGPFTFDFDRMDFRRDGVSVELSKTEQRLLRVLVENRGHAVPRATLVDRVWTDGAEFVEENALSVTVKRLRNKLEADPAKPEYLKTVYGIGYTWAVKP